MLFFVFEGLFPLFLMRKPVRKLSSVEQRNPRTIPAIRHPELVSGSDMYQCLQGFFAFVLLAILGKIPSVLGMTYCLH